MRRINHEGVIHISILSNCYISINIFNIEKLPHYLPHFFICCLVFNQCNIQFFMNQIAICCICFTATRWNFIEHRITLVGEHSGSTLAVLMCLYCNRWQQTDCYRMPFFGARFLCRNPFRGGRFINCKFYPCLNFVRNVRNVRITF